MDQNDIWYAKEAVIIYGLGTDRQVDATKYIIFTKAMRSKNMSKV